MKKIIIYPIRLSFLVALVFLMSCGGNENNDNSEVETPKTEEELAWEKALAEKEEIVPLDQELDRLYENVTGFQKLAFESEMAKINGSQSLIAEVEQSMSKYDRNTLSKIKEDLKLMEAMLYTEETLADEELVDKYDTHTEDVIEGWKTFSENTEEFDNHARALAFYEDIMSADSQDAQIRRNYNIYVHDYNVILETKAEEVKALGEKYMTMKPYKFFYGSDPVVM